MNDQSDLSEDEDEDEEVTSLLDPDPLDDSEEEWVSAEFVCLFVGSFLERIVDIQLRRRNA